MWPIFSQKSAKLPSNKQSSATTNNSPSKENVPSRKGAYEEVEALCEANLGRQDSNAGNRIKKIS